MRQHLNILKGAALAVGLALALTACSTPEAEPKAVTTPDVEPATAATETPRPEESPTPEEPAKSPRGNLVKQVNEVFGYGDAIDDLDASFVVTGITVSPECTGEWVEAPEHGHFVKVDIEGATRPEFEGEVFFGGWIVIAENGTTFNGSPHTAAAWSCLPDTEQFPSLVGPGERVVGSVVLDVPTAKGTLVLDPTGSGGWEWTY